MIELRRRIMTVANNVLSRVEYIETTGTQWINTLYRPNQNTRVVCEMQHTGNTQWGRLFGCSSGTKWNSTPVFQVDYETDVTGNLRYIIGNETSWNILSSVTGDYNRHTYDFSTTKFLRDGVQVATHSAVTFQCTTEMAIFAYMRTDDIQVGDSAMIGRLYSFKIYEGDTLVRDFIPVRVGTVGYLYDKVTEQLYSNQGSGEFVTGPDITVYNITITLTGDSVSGITVTVTDSAGVLHSGTTDSNGVVHLSDVVGGSADVSASGYTLSPSIINVNSSSRNFAIECSSITDYVDLGLPSGLLWATCNIGADSPEEVGLYFQWGDIVGRTPSDGNSYYTSSAYSSTPGASLTGDIPANGTYDAAMAILGGAWRMPTRNEFIELKNNTIREWTGSFNGTGVKGNIYYKKDSSGNKVSDTFIFLPLTGRMMDYGLNGAGTTVNLWSSTLYGNTSYGYTLYSIQTSDDADSGQYRYAGVPIRAVCNP